MIKAILFDVDGVLYDSMPAHTESWQEAFAEVEIQIPSLTVYEVEGSTDEQAARIMLAKTGKALSDKKLREVLHRKAEIYDKHAKPKIMPGALEFIDQLRNTIKLGAVTGSNQEDTIKKLKKDFDFAEENIVTGADVKKGKPDPEPYLIGLRKLNTKSHNALAIENAPLGVQSAVRAGMKCFALQTGQVRPENLKASGADQIFENFAQLTKYWKVEKPR